MCCICRQVADTRVHIIQTDSITETYEETGRPRPNSSLVKRNEDFKVVTDEAALSSNSLYIFSVLLGFFPDMATDILLLPQPSTLVCYVSEFLSFF